MPEHSNRPCGQTQSALVQTRPPVQTLPQEPQLLRLVLVSTHWPLQRTRPDWQVQVPPVQAVPGGQALLQAPQWALLVAVSTQLVPQTIWPEGHAAREASTEEDP